MNTVLQVPIKKDIRDSAVRAAEKMGFSSLQEPVRIFLNQLANGDIKISLEQRRAIDTVLNSKREADEGKVKLLRSLKDLR